MFSTGPAKHSNAHQPRSSGKLSASGCECSWTFDKAFWKTDLRACYKISSFIGQLNSTCWQIDSSVYRYAQAIGQQI